MTDEEKTEEIINNFLRQRKFYFSDLDMARDLIKIALAEERKEGYEQGKETLLEMNEVLDSIDAKAKIKSLKKENAELKKKQRVDGQCEACKLGDLIVENAKLKEENEDLRKFAETLSENHANEWQEQQQVITELRNKLDKVSKWIKEQECPDGCIDCSAWDTYKLKEILK